MRYLFIALLVLAGCSSDEKPVDANLSYTVRSAGGRIKVEGRSKTDAATAKASAMVDQMIIDAADK